MGSKVGLGAVGAVGAVLFTIALYAAVILGAALLLGCGPRPGLNVDALADSIELSGDLRCEGEGELSVLGFLSVRVEGVAAAGGDVAGSGDTEGKACAGVRISLGPLVWIWTAETQTNEGCVPGVKIERRPNDG